MSTECWKRSYKTWAEVTQILEKIGNDGEILEIGLIENIVITPHPDNPEKYEVDIHVSNDEDKES